MKKIIDFWNKNKEKKVYISILTVVFIAILMLNLFTPLLNDDFPYSLYKGKKITSIFTVFKSQYEHYFGWGGRNVVHFIAQTFLMFDKNVFNIFNTIVFILYIYLIYFHATFKKEYKVSTLVLILFLAWYFMPSFGETILWLVGTCNYLWGTTIILMFLLPFRMSLVKTIKMNWFQELLFIVLGLLAGWTNENTSAAMLFMIFLIIIKQAKDKNIKRWQITSYVASIIGFALMILAPGNFGRAKFYVEDGNKIVIILKKFLRYTIQANQNVMLLYIILLIIFIINYYYNKDKKNILIHTAILISGSIVGIYSMLAAPIFPDRAWFGLITFLIIAIAYNFNNLPFTKNDCFNMIKLSVCGILLLGFMLEYGKLLEDVININKVYKQRENIIVKSKKAGNFDVELPIYHTDIKKSPLYNIVDISDQTEENKNIASYYGINSIIGKN